MNVGTFKLVIEYYAQHTNELQRVAFSNVSRPAVERYVKYFKRKYDVVNAMACDHPRPVVSF